MIFDPIALNFADSTQLWLEVSETDRAEAWRQSQSSHNSSRWNAYLNQVCLRTFLHWLREEYAPEATPIPNAATLASVWEVVNGSAIALGKTRFVLVPTETIDLSELRVPQEWVDIPSWAADYYLAAQVSSDEGLVRIWGYATHQQLKTSGNYDRCDRTYCLDEEELTPDLNVLWVARQLGIESQTRQAIAPLPTLPLAQAENLLQRLGNPAVITPRLAVPFKLWGALLEHGGWRQRLYHRRIGATEQWSIIRWLENGVSDVAHQLGWGRVEFQTSLAAARGTELTPAQTILSRQLVIAGQHYELRIVPQHNSEQQIWRFELQSAVGNQVPSGFKLRLLTEDLQPFENNEDVATTAVDQLFVKVALDPGEGLVWEIEPVPENYQRETLRF